MAKLRPVGGAPNASEVSWEGDITPPVTTYASAAANLPMKSRLNVPASTNRTGSPVVSRAERRDGLQYFYSHGGTRMPVPGVPRPGPGGVVSSAFQTTLVQLHDWVINRKWYAAGYPRGGSVFTGGIRLDSSFRGPQPQTMYTGGPTKAAMQQRPLFPAVQTVQRYGVTVRRYPTRATKS